MNHFDRLCAIRILARRGEPVEWAEKHWLGLGPSVRAIERRGMLAVLRDMREPSAEMCDEPLRQMPEHASWLNARAAFFVWQAMLDDLIAQAEASETEAAE